MSEAHPTRPELVGSFGMAASTHWLATATAMAVLERGGNAFDAAAAGGFVLQVVEPHLNGPGGEVPIILWSASERRAHVVCGQGVAPAAATPEAMRALGIDLIPGTGLLPATVPGAFGGWTLMLERFGSWELADVLAFALGYCRAGFPALPRVSATIAGAAEMFREQWPTSAVAWLTGPGGGAPAAGSRLTSPGLAATYERVLAEAAARGSTRESRIAAARDCWYRGFVAEEIERFCARAVPDGTGEPHAGLLTAADMAIWEPTFEAPVSVDYAGVTVCKTGPWGQGPVFLAQLALLEGFDLGSAGFLSADWIHLVTECSKLAFADREAWYGDSPLVPDTVGALLDPRYVAERRTLVGARASRELRPGTIAGVAPRLPALSRRGAAGRRPGTAGVGEPTLEPDPGARRPVPALEPDPDARGDTCHIDVVDRFGNMVSATPSGGWLQSSPHITSLGFCLGTRGQMFALDRGTANTLTPRRRPRTTLSPSLALRDGEPWLAFGTPGGDQQDQWSLSLLLTLVHTDLNLQQAIDAPAFHNDHFPSSFYPREAHPGRLIVERRIEPPVVEELRRRGHEVVVVEPWRLGRLSAVARSAGFLRAGANARGSQGYAAGR
ncbi:MAG TPA: gamma-glutamyltransferase [Solirubrobacteraceae bacterium]|nr:gamma-glutamyltransferase [Solirubrobacteraceae bacterium]